MLNTASGSMLSRYLVAMASLHVSEGTPAHYVASQDRALLRCTFSAWIVNSIQLVRRPLPILADPIHPATVKLLSVQVACIAHFQNEPLSFLAAAEDQRACCAGLPGPVLHQGLQGLPKEVATGTAWSATEPHSCIQPIATYLP